MFILTSSTVREKCRLQWSRRFKRCQSRLRCSIVSIFVISVLTCAILRHAALSPTHKSGILGGTARASAERLSGKSSYRTHVKLIKRVEIQQAAERVSQALKAHSIAMPYGPTLESIMSSHNGEGELRISLGGTSFCLDTMSQGLGGTPNVFPCHHQGGTQSWSYNIESQTIKSSRPGVGCIGATADGAIKLVDCDSQPFELRSWDWKSSGQLIIRSDIDLKMTFPVSAPRSLCLAVNLQNNNKKHLVLKPCAAYFSSKSPYDAHQRWVLVKPSMQSDSAARREYDFDEVVSAAIGARRSVPDIRAPGCKGYINTVHKDYGLTANVGSTISSMFRHAETLVKRLEPTSIIICFVDEEWWALLRTLHSVLDRSPAVLIHEIILLDDGSEAPHLGLPLEAYVSALPSRPKVSIVRTHKRLGLIKARLLGAAKASSDVLTFLDSHIEVADGWLEPLLVELTEESDLVVTPQIVVTSQDTLNFQSSVSHDNIAYGQFNWDLVFHWAYTRLETPPGPLRAKNIDPVESPAMAGGIYSIRKSYFERIGLYDDEMEGWGAENVEMSMRVWMCGGSIKLIPCSIVSHIFRQKNPTKFPGTNVHKVLMHNRKRTVDVWFDPPYRDLFYRLQGRAQDTDRGDVSNRMELRKNLKCKSFEWYASNLMANVLPPIPANLQDRGQVMIASSVDDSTHSKCLGLETTKPEAVPCPCKTIAVECGNGEDSSTNFYFSKKGELRGTDWPRIKWCLMQDRVGSDKLTIDTCHVAKKDLGLQRWKLESSDDSGGRFSLRHIRSGRCLSAILGGQGPEAVKLDACDQSSVLQKVSFRTTFGGKYSGIRAFPVDTSTEEASAKFSPQKLLEVKSSKRSIVGDHQIMSRKLRTISVVLPCASENMLMVNTVRSIFENTPENILEEIIVVDDGSVHPLKSMWPADDADPDGVDGVPASGFDPYPKKGHWGKIRKRLRFLRHEKTLGLMKSRTTGANAAKGDIIAMFDCHVKPDKNWWPSVLSQISENYRRVTIPVITRLDVDTWKEIGRRPTPGTGMSSCYFTWDSEFKWANNRFWKPGNQRWVPMMSGGLLAMSREWWGELGGYDEKMKGWGGENIDQSLRIWLCGGEIVSLDDSYIAHMWRDNSNPKTLRKYKSVGDTLRNRWRAASAWLGDFKAKTLTFPDFQRFRFQTPTEDLTAYAQVKSRLNCKNFEWYIDRFADIYHKAGLMPETVFQLESQRAPGICLERTGSVLGHAKIAHGPLSLAHCNKDERLQLFHRANRAADGECCSGLRGYDSDQCIRYNEQIGNGAESFDTSVCIIDGSNPTQIATLGSDGRIVLGSHHDLCLQIVPAQVEESTIHEAATLLKPNAWALAAVPCDRAAENAVPRPKILPKWNKIAERSSLEREIYDRLKISKNLDTRVINSN